MRMETQAAEELKRTRVIVFDEATMAHKNIYKAIDHLLRDIMDTNTPFGGKIMLLGGAIFSIPYEAFMFQETGNSSSPSSQAHPVMKQCGTHSR